MKQKLLLTITLWLALFGSAWAQSNNALHFSYATKNRVDIGAFAAGSPNFSQGFTFAGWVKFDQFKDLARVFTFAPSQTDGSNNLMLSASGTTGLIMAEVNVQKVTTTTPLQTNKWYFLTLTVTSGGVTTIYVDGVMAASETLTAPANLDRNTCYLGNSSYDEARGLNGSLDEVSIWSRALTAAEITGIMSGISSPASQTGLLAYYNFNQGTAGGTNTAITTLTDASPNGKNGTLKDFALTGATSNWVEGYTPPTPPAANNALHFDGNGDYVDCPAINPTNFTVEAWVYPTTLGKDQAIVSTLNVNGKVGMELHLGTDNKPIITINNNSSFVDVIGEKTVAANTWTHLAATYDGTYVKLFVNGTEAKSESYSSYQKGTAPVNLGKRYNETDYYFSGRIDEVRIWSAARSQTEIAAAKDNPLTGTESNLLAYYNFNQGTAGGDNTTITTLTDATTNAKHGTLNGFTLSGTASNFVEGFVPPTAPSKHLTVSPTTLILGSANGSSATITVTSNTDWEISPIFQGTTWAEVNPTTGSGNGSFTVTTTSENTGATGRGAVLNISGEDVESIFMSIGQSAPAAPKPITFIYTLPGIAPFASTGSSLTDAMDKVTVPLNLIKTITINEGDFTTADWEWLKANKNNFASLTSFTIAPTVNSVADVPDVTTTERFFNTSIEELYLAKVNNIGTFAFNTLTNLSNVSLPDARLIKNSALMNCTRLNNISIPQCTNLETRVFHSCTSLTNLLLSATPPSITSQTFYFCPTPRYLSYADANGNLLTGTELENARAAYRVVDDGITTDNLWNNWTIDRNLYKVDVATPTNGTLTAGNPDAAVFGAYPAGATINVTATPNSNYWLSSLKFTQQGVTGETNITGGTFTMPEGNVTVSATFQPKLFAGPSTFSLDKTKDSKFYVDIVSEKAWTIEGNIPSWLYVSCIYGLAGSNKIQFTSLEDNPWAFERTVTLTLKSDGANDVTLTVKQLPADPQTTFSARFVKLDWQQGSTATIEMQSNEQWSVTHNMPAEYWQVEPTSGTGNATLTITTPNYNNSGVELEGQIKINNHVIYLKQKYNAKPLATSDTRIRLSAQKGSSVQVQVTSETSWLFMMPMAPELPDWLSVSPSSGTGNATVTFTAKHDLTGMLNNAAYIELAGNGAYPVEIIVEQAPDNMPLGKGTKEEPYLISTFDNLMWMSQNTEEELYNMPDIYYQLANDIDASVSHTIEGGFPGIPYYNTHRPFHGQFHGKGYAIKNFLSTKGLFTNLSDQARIDSLALVNVMVQGAQVGGLVSINYGSVNACYVTGNLLGNGCGLLAYTNLDEGSITDCYVMGSLAGIGSGIVYIGKNVERCYVVASYASKNDGVFNYSGSTNINGYYNSDIYPTLTASQSPDVHGLTTVQMTQQDSYTGWDFANKWSITEDESFPRIKGVYNYPTLMPTYMQVGEIDELYETTLVTIRMDANIKKTELTNAPAGMTLDGNTISWTPASGGWYNITVTLTDANSRTADYTIPISIRLKGEGTEDKPYQITTIAELNTMRYMEANAHYRLMNDLDFADTEYSKENSEQGWLPLSFGGDILGMSKESFHGYFHGGGHVIRNLYINRPYTVAPAGLFEVVYDGTIDSLGLENVLIEGNERVGALAGQMNAAQITACYVTGTVRGFEKTGGLVGEAIDKTGFYRCYANVTVQGTSRILNENVVTRYHFGALAGSFDNGSIENCYAAGSVTGAVQAGGMCGSLYLTSITHSYSTAVGCNANGSYYGLASLNDYNTVTNTYCYKPFHVREKQFYPADGVTTLDLFQITKQASYTDWDFANTWEITEGQTLPRLRGMKNFPVLLPVNDVAHMNVEYNAYLDMIQMGSPVSSFATSGVEGITFVDEGGIAVNWTPVTLEQPTLTVSIKAENGDSIAIATIIEVIPFAGEGTVDNPYQITTIDQLGWISRNIGFWDKHYVQTTNIDATDTRNWDNGSGFLPIGNEENTFSGTYNGKGHTINGLYINRESPFNGLFGMCYDSNIDSLGIINANISGKDRNGVLAGFAGNSVISNCYSSGNVTGDYSIGGLVGMNFNFSTISNCYSAGNVSGRHNVGGLVGNNSFYTSVQKSYSTCNVVGIELAGGLVGDNYDKASLINSYFAGSVSGDDIKGTLVGHNDSYVNNCYWDTQILDQPLDFGIALANSDTNNLLGITTKQMMAAQNLTNLGSFETTWQIRTDSTYPALRAVNNAPFAFRDTIYAGANANLSLLLANDYDYETLNENLVLRVTEIYNTGTTDYRTYYAFAQNALIDNVDSILYQVGQVTLPGDTLWGGFAKAIIIKDINQAPDVITAETYINEDTAIENFDITAYSTDPNNDLVTLYSLNNNYPKNGTVTTNGNFITYVPNSNFNGIDSIVYNVSDGILTAVCVFTINIDPVNDAPVLTEVVNQTINEDEILTLTLDDIIATDADGDELQLIIASGEYYIVDGLKIIPESDYYGSLLVDLTIYDGQLTSDTITMIVNVQPVNDAPEINGAGYFVIHEDETITLTNNHVSIYDADSDELQLLVYEGEHYTVNGTTVTPAANFNGTLNVALAVTDGELTSAQIVMELTVNEVNDAPVLHSVSNKTINEGDYFTITLNDVVVTDVDNSALMVNIPEGENYNVEGENIIPDENFNGLLTFALSVTDGELNSDTLIMEVTVLPVNDEPVINNVLNKTVYEDESFTITFDDIVATDIDGDSLQIVVTGNNNYTFSGNTVTPVNNFNGSLIVPVYVTDGNLNSATSNIEVTVLPVAEIVDIQWQNPAAIIYGTALSTTQLNAVAKVADVVVEGTYEYSPAVGTVLNAGSAHEILVLFTPTDTENYETATASVTIDVTKAELAVTANNQTIELGSAIPALTVAYAGFVNNDTETVLDTKPVATTTATADSPAGEYEITVAGGADNNYSFTYVAGKLTITAKQVPVITWAAPGAIVYGTALSTTQLNAVAKVADVVVEGTYEYSPAIGTVLNAGSAQVLSVTFTPTDAETYETATASVIIDVTKAELTATANNQIIELGSAIPELTVAYAGFVNNDTETVLDTKPVATTTATAESPAGEYDITVAGGADNNYSFTYVAGKLTITTKQVPVITWATPDTIAYGTALSATQLNAVAKIDDVVVEGTYEYSPAVGTVLNAGSAQVLSVTFTPTDAETYETTTASVSIDVTKAELTATANNQTIELGSAIPELTVAYAGFVNNDTETVLDTKPVATTTTTAESAAGEYEITVAGGVDNNYNFVYVTGKLTITAKKIPTLIWENPSNIVYGSLLSNVQYNAVATFGGKTIDGTFEYSPAIGTVLNAGSAQVLSVTFTPADAETYETATASVTIDVTKAELTATANNQIIELGSAIPELTVAYAGFVNSDDESVIDVKPVATTTATVESAAGEYDITVDGGADNNYSFTYVAGKLTITPKTVTPELNVSVTELKVEALEASTASFEITANIDWTVTVSETWLTASAANGNGNSQITLTAAANKTTSKRVATVTVAGNGVQSKTITVTQDAGVGVDDNNAFVFSVYPNPATYNINVSIANGLSDGTIEVFNIAGVKVCQQPLTGILTNINVAKMPQGLYIIKVLAGEHTAVSRFVKN